MATFLRNEYIFGPIISRRLGRSLGVNITPLNRKVCSFNCIYCECGWNALASSANNFPTREEIKLALEDKLKEMKQKEQDFDSITFSGNGEPTLHPDFHNIIDDTIGIRNKLFPNVKITVLSNSTNLHKDSVVSALKKIENPILKIDSANIETLRKINQPTSKTFSIEKIVSGMKQFDGDFIMQTMFLKGEHNGNFIDNTSEEEVNGLIEVMRETRPRLIMIYPIDRETPAQNLVKLDKVEMLRLENMISKAGFNVVASGT